MPVSWAHSCLCIQVKALWAASDALCSGDLDFVISIDKAGVPRWAQTTPNLNRPTFREWKLYHHESLDLPAASKVMHTILNHTNLKQEGVSISDKDVDRMVVIQNKFDKYDCIRMASWGGIVGTLQMDHKVLHGYWKGPMIDDYLGLDDYLAAMDDFCAAIPNGANKIINVSNVPHWYSQDTIGVTFETGPT